MSPASNLEQVKKLRDETGLGVMECQKALEKAGGDPDKARQLLKSRGAEISARKSDRKAGQGSIAAYVHNGNKVGAMIEVNCETDFVARNEIFQEMIRNLCLQVVAARPSYVRAEDVPAEEIESRREWWLKDFAEKPAPVQEKIMKGKTAEYLKEVALLEQAYIREPDKSVQEYINETIARLGENITVRRFVRMELGS